MGVAVDDDTLSALEALGYVEATATANPEDRGVVTAAPDNARGLNLYGSRDRAEVLLTDMAGEVVHRWSSADDASWMLAVPAEDGSILAIEKDRRLSKYDWDSTVVWRAPLRVHHDVAVRDDGRILALVRGETTTTHGGARLPILCDSIARLSPDGEVEELTPLLPLLRQHLDGGRLARLAARVASGESTRPLLRPGGLADVLHTNSISFLHRDIEGIAPSGSVLLSFRALSRIAILDAGLSEVLFIWGGGELDGQHDATQTRSGNILLFDNGLRRRSRSRVVEVDARSGEIVWTYGPDDLFTRMRGGAQELPSGNILVTESDEGHAIEVNRAGETIWEFWNPDVRGSGDDAERATIYRLNRFSTTFFSPLVTD